MDPVNMNPAQMAQMHHSLQEKRIYVRMQHIRRWAQIFLLSMKNCSPIPVFVRRNFIIKILKSVTNLLSEMISDIACPCIVHVDILI
jgi:DMSO reductase anchor subunit